jgi:hypothetical protein
MAAFISNPKRDASDVIAGFVYQVDVTILRWLQLKDDEVLELERGEDLAIVQMEAGETPEGRTLEQIKRRSSALSLKSGDALEALAHFCEHRKKNPSLRLRSRFITTGSLAREKAWDLPGSAIESWQAIFREELPDTEQEVAVQAIQRFLQQCRPPAGLDSLTWAALQELVEGKNQGQLLDLIRSFEWSLAVVDHPELQDDVKRELIALGLAGDAAMATALFERLFLYVFNRLTEKGLKRLTVAELRARLRPAPLTEAEKAFLEFIQGQRAVLQSKVTALEREVAQHQEVLATLESRTTVLGERIRGGIEFSIPSSTLDPPALVKPSIPRSTTVGEIRRQLPRKTWINVVGEPGAGKTQLCLLAASEANSEVLWINLRGYNSEQASNVLDLALQTASSVPSHPLLQGWYREAISRIGAGRVLVLDDLPRVVTGGALGRRLDALCGACAQHGMRMLSATYFELPQTFVESHPIAEIHAPRFARDEITQLFAAHGAPAGFAAVQYADFLLTLTQGLPILIAAGVRLLETKSWQVTWKDIEAFFSGEFARGIKKDAKVMIERTVSETEARELLYRLTCVIGPISKEHIERITKIPTEIRLGLEKFDQLVGLWVQPYSRDTYLLSPLVETSLSNLLDPRTRRAVHASLGALVLKRKTRTPMDIVTCVLHFQQADLLDQAAAVLVHALMKLTEINREIPNESLISSIWTSGPLPDSIDLNMRLHLRALQVGFADKRGQDFSYLLADLDKLMAQAQANPDAQIGVFAASGSIAIRFGRKYPSIANRYLLAMLGSASKAILPDGTKLPSAYPVSLESLLWATGSATTSDDDIIDWLDTLRHLTPEQLGRFMASELAADNCVVICDFAWLREYRKPESERNWPGCEAILQQIETTASELDLALLSTAALRTRLTILAESQGKLDAAIILAEDRLAHVASKEERFLIAEVIGRELAYAKRWEEGLRWMKMALKVKTNEYAVLRRNLLVTVSEGVALRDPHAATEWTSQAVEVAKSGGLESIRVAESLGEHSIALWNAGRRGDSFLVWQEAIESLLKARDQRPSWTQAFLAFLHAAGYFSGMSLFGKVSPDYAAPKPGLFLAVDNIPVEKYQPIQDGLLLLRTAMFAEGVCQTSAAAKWAKVALSEAGRQPGADMLQAFAWLPIPDAVISGNYSDAIQRGYAMSQLRAPDAPSLETFKVGSADEVKIQQIYSPRRMIERGLLFGPVLITFRLATVRFDGDISGDVDAVISLLEQVSSEVGNDWRQSADVIKLLFSGQRTWREFHTDGERYYAEGRVALGVMSFIGSLLGAPLKQSLASQIRTAKDLEKLFEISPSIRHNLLEPFFVRFWADAINQVGAEFRTSAAYTSRSYAEAASSPTGVRLKKVFASMVFCMGLSVPEDLGSWINAVE